MTKVIIGCNTDREQYSSDFEVSGIYDICNCGCPSRWSIIDDDPVKYSEENRYKSFDWKVRYVKRYVFVFMLFNDDSIFEETEYYKKLCNEFDITDKSCIEQSGMFYIFQSDRTPTEWDKSSAIWDDLEGDDLGGQLNLIDTHDFSDQQ